MPSPDERSVGDDDGDDFPLRIDSAKVPPRGGGVSSEKMASYFFPIERLHIVEDGHRRVARGPTRQGGVPGG